jgi:23S rRNA maturation-related 3'-5' exoribonuclease YhaM
MKDIYIADLSSFDEGKPFDGFFLVLSKQQRLTKTNKPYLNLILGDKTGQLEGASGNRATHASPKISTRAT